MDVLMRLMFKSGRKVSQEAIPAFSSETKTRSVRPKLTQFLFTALALTIVTAFAVWWFNPSHVPSNFSGTLKFLDVILFLFVSFVIWHPIIMEVLTWSISSHIKELPEYEPQPGLKVAFITTIVPANESLELLHKCLPAMVNAEYKHDTWLLDEGNNEKVKEICRQYGVYHFSRYGLSNYNTPEGKFTKTKGGNHNSWYDVYGNFYDIVAQVDTDFVPKANFLTKTLGYFRDPQVAFVGTPQIYGNTSSSFVARGAAEQLYSFYGSILRGLSGMGATLLIGANHIIRVSALKDVGLYSAHITEDLLTGMKLHTKGWKSVYLPDALAVGEGPATWQAYFDQQMRWAYGCMDILFNHSPKLFPKMEFRRRIYYFFLQQHYFSGIAMALSIVLLMFYFGIGLRAADVDFLQFSLSYSFILLICWLMSVWLQMYHIHPGKESGLLVAGKIISIAAWPIWFVAFISVLLGKRLRYKVTPKGETDTSDNTPISVFLPHLIFGLIVCLGLISSLLTQRQDTAMIIWALNSMLLMFLVPFIQKTENTFSKTFSFAQHIIQNLIDKNTQHLINMKNSDYAVNYSRYIGTFSSGINSEKLDRTGKTETAMDILFLSLVVMMSVVLYVGSLGFYSDDWSFLGSFSLAANSSLTGLIQTATTPNTLMRPVQNFLDAALFWLFGMNPLGYHLFNAGILLSIALIFYLVLRQLKVTRIIALSLPLIYILLPNYSTDRFWFASFQANVSMLLYFVSLYSGLRAISVRTRHTIAWKTLSLAGMVLSILSYEVVIPFYLINLILFWNPAEIFNSLNKPQKQSRSNNSVFILVTFFTLLYALIFKAKTTIRTSGDLFQNLTDYPGYLWQVVVSSFQVNYISYVWNLPYLMWQISRDYADPVILSVGTILGVLIFWYLNSVVASPLASFPGKYWMRGLGLLSLFVFFLGYAIFITNQNVAFSSTGVANRVAIAAAVGVALSIIAAIGWISHYLPSEKAVRRFFCLSVAVVCAAGFIIIQTLASFWITAYRTQQVVIADIQHHVPLLPKNATLILDGVCPYIGPASVFESEWDLKGVLQIIYRDPTVQADVVTPGIRVTPDGLETKIYNSTRLYPFYPYGELFIYNYKNKKIYPLPDIHAANFYFERINPNYKTSCPDGTEGSGVEVFR